MDSQWVEIHSHKSSHKRDHCTHPTNIQNRQHRECTLALYTALCWRQKATQDSFLKFFLDRLRNTECRKNTVLWYKYKLKRRVVDNKASCYKAAWMYKNFMIKKELKQKMKFIQQISLRKQTDLPSSIHLNALNQSENCTWHKSTVKTRESAVEIYLFTNKYDLW